jgi:hypothetical protein
MKLPLAAIGALALVSSASAAGSLSAEQSQWISRAERHGKAGWIYLHVEGGPEERGFQHGYLLAPEISECLRVLRAEWLHESSMDWNWLVANTRGFIEPKIDSEDAAELRGIAEGMQAAGRPATYDDIVTYNASIELTDYWWPLAKRKLTGTADRVATPRESCSSFIATGRMTRGGGIVLGHNTMADYTDAVANVVIDIAPSSGHRILMQIQPGWIDSGTDFFITDAGLVGSETTIGGFEHFSESGVPEFIRMRRATQDADSIDRWCAILRKGNNGGYANAWLLGDVRTGEIARLELGLQYVGLERTRDGYYVGSNIAENLHILRLETTADDSDIRRSPVARRVRWHQLMRAEAGRIDVEAAKAMEGDDFDVFENRVDPDGRTLAGHAELAADPAAGSAPFYPHGSFDCKVVDSAMARGMSFAARWGSADGIPFDAAAFLAAHPQYGWMDGLIRSRPTEPWVVFTSGEKP